MILLLALLVAAPDPGRDLAKHVQRFYARAKDFSAHFTQDYDYVSMGRTEHSEGTVRIKKPAFVRWDYEKPDKRLIYVENHTLWIYRPDDNEVQVKRDFGGDQLSSAFTFLWGKGDLLKEFKAERKGDELQLTPIKPVPGVAKLVFTVSKEGAVISSVVTNPQGDINKFIFSEVKLNQNLPESDFHFQPPKGAYVQEF